MLQQIAKPRICLRFCVGLVGNFRELSNSPSGFGVRNLTYVVGEPDTFYLILKQGLSKAKEKQRGRQWPRPFMNLISAKNSPYVSVK